MIERKFVAQRMKEFGIEEFIGEKLKNVGYSGIKLQKTPLGEKIIIFASRPGLIVGRKGENIQKLTRTLKEQFELENPQIEISEIDNINLDPKIVAEKIALTMERFGSSKFKAIGHKTMSEVLASGALGVEILISGKVPSSRAKRWRFYMGYLKKCGDIAISGVKVAYTAAKLKTGVVGIQVRIMPSDLILPDKIKVLEEAITEETSEEISEEEIKKDIKKAEKGSKAKEEKKTKKSEKEEKEEISEDLEEEIEELVTEIDDIDEELI